MNNIDLVNEALSLFGDDTGYVVTYTVEEIRLGRVANKEISYTQEFHGYDSLREMRIFNKDKEVKLIYNDEEKTIIGPTLTIDEGESFDEFLSLGESRGQKDGNTFAGRDGEKKMLLYPVEFASTGYLRVRNYIAYDSDDIAYIKKSRYVDFTNEKEGK